MASLFDRSRAARAAELTPYVALIHRWPSTGGVERVYLLLHQPSLPAALAAAGAVVQEQDGLTVRKYDISIEKATNLKIEHQHRNIEGCREIAEYDYFTYLTQLVAAR